MTVQDTKKYVFNDANNAVFMRTAGGVADSKINYDKAYTRQLDIMNHFCTLSEQCLGKDYKFLQDGASTRLYIRDVFGEKALRLFEDNRGEIFLDIEHGLVFFHYLKSQNSPLLNTALGLLYFIAAHQLSHEFDSISKVAPKNLIKPLFEFSPNLFRWKRCNFVLRKYMLSLSLDRGVQEQGYFYEMPNNNQIAYLLHKGFTLQDAKNHMANMQGGLFYTYIPKDIENMLLPSIFLGHVTPLGMDGYYTQSLIQDFNTIAKEYTLNDVYNVYTQFIKPILIDMMGILVGAVQKELNANAAIGGNDARIYHLSPSRLGLAVQNGIPIEVAIPSLVKHFQPVKPITHFNLLAGEHLY